VDEELARKILAVDGTVVRGARANRRFMHRAVRTAAEAGVRQFLDIGTGIPTEPNLHQVAQGVAPESRVVYADNDPIVLRHAEALLQSSAEGATDYIHADARDPGTILRLAGESLDLGRPVALSLVALTHYLGDQEDDVFGLVKRYVDELAPGSFLILTQVTQDLSPEGVARAAELFRRSGTPFHPRTLPEFSRFFDGLELLGPGVIPVYGWRPEPVDVAAQAEGVVPVYAGVAVKR
jgi:O-methyltransferase involved in polyketide biosynthesis